MTTTHLDRRSFIELSGVGLAGVLVGCGTTAAEADGAAAATSNGEGPDPDPIDPIDPVDPIDPIDPVDPTCGDSTESNIQGPFFTANSPQTTDITEPGVLGTKLRLSGRVLTPQCEPVPGALLDFWQANDAGGYDNVGYDFRGHQFTDARGRYSLTTIIPGRYLNGATYRPAHIHVKVGTAAAVLTTQLYFAGDPFNNSDAFIRDSLIMTTQTAADGVTEATFDFVL